MNKKWDIFPGIFAECYPRLTQKSAAPALDNFFPQPFLGQMSHRRKESGNYSGILAAFFVPSKHSLSRCVFAGRPTHALVQFLDWLARHTLPPGKIAAHQRTGRRGEEAAYFHLRKLGYTMVARNFRSPRCPGEIDLIGWEDDVLCFIEVKTRTTRDVKPGEAAVDRHKRRSIAAVIREYLRQLPPLCQWRFDIVSVYYDQSKASRPQIEVFRNSSLTA